MMLRIHSADQSTAPVIGSVQIVAKWNQTSLQEKKFRSVWIPFENLKAEEVSHKFRPIVESALRSAAESVLKTFVNENPNSFEIPSEYFTQQSLCDSFLQRGEIWLSKEELEKSFTTSATWKRIVSKPEFTQNKTYAAVAEQFKQTILKLSGKATRIPPETCDKILSKIEESDLETPFGAFVFKRLDSLRKNSVPDSFDLDAL